jgi:hypothetical protein
MKINHKYYVNYEEVNNFEFKAFNKLVNVTQYEEHIIPEIPRIISLLNNDIDTRQAVIIVSEGIGTKTNMNSCLLSLQFQIAEEVKRNVWFENGIQSISFNKELTLFMTSNYRSQCSRYGQPNDEMMLKFIATLIKKELKHKIKNVEILCNVGNYHRREENWDFATNGKNSTFVN